MNNSDIQLINIDFETLSNNPCNGISISFAAIPFKLGINDSFESLQEKAFFCKLNVDAQSKHGKKPMKATLEWWQSLPKDVFKESMPKPNEGLTPDEFVVAFDEFIASLNVPRNKIILCCRGCSFDITLLNNFYRIVHGVEDVSNLTPQQFWNELCIRSFIKGMMLTLDARRIPIDKNLLEGFKAHNPIHDVCKDVICIQEAYAYATGSKEIPSDDIIMA